MVGIADVARHAKVSASTVSYVLSGKRPISPATKERVHASIRALDYHPHAGARALASKRSSVIALAMPLRSGMHLPVLMQFVIAVAERARRFDHDVLLSTEGEGARGLARIEGSVLADAIIVMDVELADARVPLLRSLRMPCVLIGFPTDHDGLTCIDLDFAAAGRACVEHLADLGHSRVSLVGSPPAVYERGTGYARRVSEGVVEAAAARGLAVTTHPCEASRERAARIVRELLHSRPDLTGIIVHNEPVLESVLHALRESGRRVPEDVSVLAICPDEQACRLDLTCVALPADEVGRRAVDLVMAKLAGEQVDAATLLAPQLTVRSSTGKPCGR